MIHKDVADRLGLTISDLESLCEGEATAAVAKNLALR
jgi:hypothetical protein